MCPTKKLGKINEGQAHFDCAAVDVDYGPLWSLAITAHRLFPLTTVSQHSHIHF
jgi:hypothetical protein